ncbi:DUF5133 domain-containing protein [Streptomyces sp. NPDC017936]|uniref:DUF5133 domain-containing protein n=1 Tax=Streptomyces sp. NPDC017936 TaxID=3365016 RepID=UPI0037AEBA35
MLLPAKTEVARRLRSYRVWERAMLASPGDRAVRATFENCGYTLCVLMGKRCAREAADAAEQYLRAGADARPSRGRRKRRSGVSRVGGARPVPRVAAER